MESCSQPRRKRRRTKNCVDELQHKLSYLHIEEVEVVIENEQQGGRFNPKFVLDTRSLFRWWNPEETKAVKVNEH